MLTLGQFRVSYPEFNEVDDSLVTAKLETASTRMDSSVWDKLEDEGHGLLTAHLLANTPFGNAAKLDFAKTGYFTVYEKDYKSLLKTATAGIRST